MSPLVSENRPRSLHFLSALVFVNVQDEEFTFHGTAYVDMSPLIFPGGLLISGFLSFIQTFYILTLDRF